MSNHAVEVVEPVLEPHGNADQLSVARIGGYQCVVRTQDWPSGKLGAYVPPDTLVPTEATEFKFLADKARIDGYYRVRAMKLRGALSFGLLVPAPEGSKLGDDVAQQLGCVHYEP